MSVNTRDPGVFSRDIVRAGRRAARRVDWSNVPRDFKATRHYDSLVVFTLRVQRFTVTYFDGHTEDMALTRRGIIRAHNGSVLHLAERTAAQRQAVLKALDAIAV